jgi:stage V sporulation protein G
MEITDVKVFPVREDKLKAFVSIVLDHCFMVNDIKIIQGREGMFISMPSRRKKNGDFKDVAHPLNNETRNRMSERILTEYERVLDGKGSAPGDRRPRRNKTPQETASAPTEEASEKPESAAPSDEQTKTMEEVAEKHLSESFWTA